MCWNILFRSFKRYFYTSMFIKGSPRLPPILPYQTKSTKDMESHTFVQLSNRTLSAPFHIHEFRDERQHATSPTLRVRIILLSPVDSRPRLATPSLGFKRMISRQYGNNFSFVPLGSQNLLICIMNRLNIWKIGWSCNAHTHTHPAALVIGWH